MQACHLPAEVGAGKPFCREWAKGLVDHVRGLARQVFKHPALFCVVEVFKAGVTASGRTQDIALQSLQQCALAAAAQQEVGTGFQMFLQLATSRGSGGWIGP